MDWHSSTARLLCKITGLNNPLDAIIRRVTDFIGEVKLSGPPYDMRVYASFKGISKVEVADIDCDGELRWSQQKILVNHKHTEGRRNFSIAHEIIHIIIGEACSQFFDLRCKEIGMYGSGVDEKLRNFEEEKLCDYGAAELLIPMKDFIPRIQGHSPSMANIASLARDFRASKEAVANRIPQADLWPCAIVVWEMSFKPIQSSQTNPDQYTLPGFGDMARPEKQLRVKYALPSRSFGFWIPRHKSVPEDTTIYQCFQEGITTTGVDTIDFGKRSVDKYYVESIPLDFWTDTNIMERRVLSLITRTGRPS